MENFGPFTGTVTIDFTTLDDIFLITGKTGAGKTTIFDAVCFALYGEVPGGRNACLSHLRSDFGINKHGEETCSVSLEFSLGERLFRIERSPKQERLKKSGTGTTIAEESALLYEFQKGRWESLSGRKSEADQKVKELIGLDAKEFFKIVLLPQGEFAEFLRQNTNERKEVLGKLFPVDKAARIKEIVAEKTKEAVERTREAQISLDEVLKRSPPDDFNAGRYASQLKRMKDKVAALAAEETALARKREQKQVEEALLGRLSSVKNDVDRIESESATVKEKEAALVRSRKAQPLCQKLVAVEEARHSAAQRHSAWEAADADLHEASGRAESAEKDALALDGLEAEIQDYQQTRRILLEAFEEAAALGEKRRECADEAALQWQLGGQRDVYEQKMAEKNAGIQALQAVAAQADQFDALYEQAKAAKDALMTLKNVAAEIEPLVLEEGRLHTLIAEKEARHKALKDQAPVLADELKHLEEEKAANEKAHLAAVLAVDLKKNEPCPVCGALEHPHPAPGAERIFGIDERISSLRGALQNAVKATAVCKTEQEALSAEARRVQNQTRHLREKAAEASVEPLPPLAEIEALFRKQVDELNEVTRRQSEAKHANQRLPLLYREKDGIQAQLAEQEKRLALSAEKQKQLANEITALEQKHERLLGGSGVEAALEQTKTALFNAEAAAKGYREAREKARNELAASSAREKAALSAWEEAEQNIRESSAAFELLLAASPFASAAALQDAALDPETEALFQRDIERWKEERSKIASLYEELKDSAARLKAEMASYGEDSEDRENYETIQARLEALAVEREQAEGERDAAHVELAAAERDSKLIREKREQYALLAEKSGRLTRLRDDLEGRRFPRRSFDAWLLSRRLAEVALFATKRLERMSEGRYSLLLDRNRNRGGGLSGLDLEVFDAYTGKTRPCATLSGGESFMASISLALGLADSIQARAGGIRLDAVFIDEGFGSLDESSLDKALGILDELREHRMVGLISHVGDLRSRIPSRIEIIKSGAGSRIQMSDTSR
jgi:exonuclease SbcC